MDIRSSSTATPRVAHRRKDYANTNNLASCTPRRAMLAFLLSFYFLPLVFHEQGGEMSVKFQDGKGHQDPTIRSMDHLGPDLRVRLGSVQREVGRDNDAFANFRPVPLHQAALLDDSRTVAHAVSLIRCPSGKTQKFMDALVALRHSIHLNSAYNAASDSTYGYRMYAFVHAENCGHDPELPHLLRRLGYTPRVVADPVSIVDEVPDGYFKNNVEKARCCGSAEFIKLYAFTLTDHPVFVHWDLDTLVLRPMDDLFDAILHPSASPIGQAARRRIWIQRPGFQRLPENIDAFLTRDITSAAPWEPITAVQGGFLVARPNASSLEGFKRLIRSGNYTNGRGPKSGWGRMGYGGFQGAMAYQGVLAYYYDVLVPNRHVELDVCRWNQVAADVIWRGPGKDAYGNDHMHECRDYPRYSHNFTTNTLEHGACEDCRTTPIEETMTVHYTACRKPWECLAPERRVRLRRNKDHEYRLQQITNATTCSLLMRQFYLVRRHIESLIASKSGTPAKVYDGSYRSDSFLGYCSSRGAYQPMEPLPKGFDMAQVYGL